MANPVLYPAVRTASALFTIENSPLTTSVTSQNRPDYDALLAPYKSPSLRRSLFQLLNTALPFGALWLLMLWSLGVSYWLTLALAVPTALLQVRLFMFQHDCGHGSFFRSRKANHALGFTIGVLTLMPYGYWRRTHAIHHATSGNLDQRTLGDIDTLTVREYLALSRWRRLMYRLYRHPVVLLLIGPFYQFVIKHRFPADVPRSWKREWASVHRTNLALLGVLTLAGLTIGLDRFLLVEAPVIMLSGALGVFLFYMQHQYEDTYWRYEEEWDYYDAGLRGSSYYRLPALFRWLTANIGFHHIHHLNSRIPNYHLPQCFRDNPELQGATTLGFWQSVRTLGMTLWDEDERRLIGFRALKGVRQRLADAGPEALRVPKPEATPATWR